MCTYLQVPFHEQILNNCEKHSNSIAITDKHGDLTFAELHRLSILCAKWLQSRGITKGSSILVCLPNTRWYPILFLSAACLGATISGVNTSSTREELLYYTETCSASLIICTATVSTVISQDDINIPVVAVGEGSSFPTPDSLSPGNETLSKLEHDLDDVLIMPFSSGTGGKPKCVQLTHRNYLAATASLKKAVFDVLVGGSSRRTLAFLPFYHGSGFWALVFCLLEGCHSVIMEHFHPLLMLQLIDKHKIDTINVVPAILGHLCSVDLTQHNLDLTSLTTVLCGSSPLGAELSQSMFEKFPSVQNLIQGYGMTEVVVLSHITPLGLGMEKLGSCGKLLPGFEAKVVNEEGEVVTEINVRGELHLRSEAVMKGYKPPAPQDILQEGWMRTGDIVYFDADGFYYVVDRVKDMIKVNGVQVSPAQIEDVIICHPLVAECAVIGVHHESGGERPRAYIVPVSFDVDHHQLIKEVEQLVKKKLAPHHVLKGGIVIREDLPRTSSGKVLKRQLRKEFSQN